MAGRKWTQHPPQLRRKLVKQGLDAQPIYDSNKLPGRSVRPIETILVRFYGAHKKFHAPRVNAGYIAELDEVVRFYVDASRKLCLACVNIAL